MHDARRRIHAVHCPLVAIPHDSLEAAGMRLLGQHCIGDWGLVKWLRAKSALGLAVAASHGSRARRVGLLRQLVGALTYQDGSGARVARIPLSTRCLVAACERPGEAPIAAAVVVRSWSAFRSRMKRGARGRSRSGAIAVAPERHDGMGSHAVAATPTRIRHAHIVTIRRDQLREVSARFALLQDAAKKGRREVREWIERRRRANRRCDGDSCDSCDTWGGPRRRRGDIERLRR